MLFEFEGTIYDSSDMICPEIRNNYVAHLYITRDFTHLFGAYTFGGESMEIRRIGGILLERLADATQIPELIEAVNMANAAERQLTGDPQNSTRFHHLPTH